MIQVTRLVQHINKINQIFTESILVCLFLFSLVELCFFFSLPHTFIDWREHFKFNSSHRDKKEKKKRKRARAVKLLTVLKMNEQEEEEQKNRGGST